MKVMNTIQLVHRTWNTQAAQWLAPALREDDYTLSDLKSEIEAGRASLFHVVIDGNECAALVVHQCEAQLVVQCVGGAFGTLTNFVALDGLLVSMAERCGCCSLRAHIVRPGLLRTCYAHEWVYKETVIEKTLP